MTARVRLTERQLAALRAVVDAADGGQRVVTGQDTKLTPAGGRVEIAGTTVRSLERHRLVTVSRAGDGRREVAPTAAGRERAEGRGQA